MPADRRAFLRAVSVLGLGSIAGCSSPSQPPSSTSPSAPTSMGAQTPTVRPTSTLTPTPTTTTATPTPTPDATTTAPTPSPTPTRTPTQTRTPMPTPTPTPTPSPPPDTSGPAGLARLSAADADDIDWFGYQVALSADGSTALVGAPRDEDPHGLWGGSAYLFARGDGGWLQGAKLVAEDGGPQDRFGISVALSADGTTALVGADQDENPHGVDGGSAYVFAPRDGEWVQRTKLVAWDGGPGDRFGFAVALSGDGRRALVGTPQDEDPHGLGAGSAYLFVLRADGWANEAKLAADDGGPEDIFGVSVALSGPGTTALVGAQGDENPNGERGGSAYVFGRTAGDWTQTAKLAAADGGPSDRFGHSVALSRDGSTAILGAPEDENPNGERGGSAYVFGRDGDSWAQTTKLVAADGYPLDYFGSDVALSGDGKTALVGAFGDDPNGPGSGSSYLFSRTGATWIQSAKLVSWDGQDRTNFGDSTALSADGRLALVGARTYRNATGEAVGAVYVFEP